MTDGAGVHLHVPVDVEADLAAVDWAATSLGPREGWSQSLRTVLQILLTSRFSMWMAWGPDLTFFCNDAYRRDTLAKKYPWALGRPAREVWSEIWTDIGPRIDSVLRDGVSTWDEGLQLFLERSGYSEETYHTFSYSPLTDDDGLRAGMLCVVTEDTTQVIGERRMLTLQGLSADLSTAGSEGGVWEALRSSLLDNARDLPLALVYLFDSEGDEARLVVASGAEPGGAHAPLSARAAPDDVVWPLWQAREDGELILDVSGLEGLPTGDWDVPPDRAVLLPLVVPSEEAPAGVLVVGVNPHRLLDHATLGFLRLVAGQIAASLGSARSFEAERRRSAALAQLDQAKTAFFANVSHEFRTPLTLIGGPLQEIRADAAVAGSPALLDSVETVQRNALRLGKLVNSLLEFSRLQAGRTRADFVPVDLAAVTAELAGMFAVAVSAAGLELVVDTTGLAEPVYVDPEMWEKVVFNLLSNALKFTFTGGISVRLRGEGGQAVLEVADTGTGIPEAEMPRLFERFHRIEGARSRSREGSGIGLALVAEIVALHGGEISASSSHGEGATFTITLPLGRGHLPADQVRELTAPEEGPSADAAAPFLAEALRWLPDAEEAVDDTAALAGEVLVVDDNADMRAYLTRLLRPHYRVRTAADGAQALAALAGRRPDLVLSDVMMPEVDGVELVRRIREDPALVDLPVVLLTAQAGPDASGAGFDVGADDYLVKPFTAEDLLSRVAARLSTGQERRVRQILTDLASRLSGVRRPEQVTQAVHEVLAALIGADTLSVVIHDVDANLLRLNHYPGYGAGIDQRYETATVDADSPLSEPVRSGISVVLPSLEALGERYPHMVKDYVAAGLGAGLVVALKRPTGEVWGALSISWHDAHPIAPADVALAEGIAAVTSVALARIEAADQENSVLREFQERLLELDLQSTVGVVAARYRPAEDALLVGGDWYDALTLPTGGLGVSVGDVVGKGLPAATVMSQLRSALGAAATSSRSPGEAMTMLDGYASRLPGALCATAVYVVIEPGGRLRWTCAGHPPPVVVHDHKAEVLDEGRRPPLGVPAGDGPAQGEVLLAPGSLVVLYTDGLVERREEDILTGIERLRAALEDLGHLPVGELCDALLGRMSPAGGFSDDVAVLALRVPGAGTGQFVDIAPAATDELGPSRARLRDWLATSGLDEDVAIDVLLAVSEACSNALEHGSRFDGRRVVCVEVSVHEGVVLAAVTDRGSWDPDSARSAVRGDRGRGFTIMNGAMDAVEVQRSRLGTTVLMRRRVSPSA